MYKNQYYITSKKIQIKKNFILNTFEDLYIYVEKNLKFYQIRSNGISISLIGFIIDPLNPNLSDEGVIDILSSESKNINSFFEGIQRFSGRYILLYKNRSEFIITGDACHFRRILYNNDLQNINITSSEKLFLEVNNFEHKINKVKQNFISNSEYYKNENAWFGDESIDDRLNILLPNHYLNINNKIVSRIPLIFPNNLKTDNDIIFYCSKLLHGTYEALIKRYTLWQPITAGIDSRLLLAVSKEFKNKIQYYIFDHWNGQHQDVIISKRLADKLSLNFSIIKTEPLKGEFINKFKDEFLNPRYLPKTSQIQYHYIHNQQKNIMNINGNALAIAKVPYGYTNRKIGLKMLILYSGYSQKIPFIKKQILNWFSSAKPYSEKYKIPLLDLFYWEQRMGNWGAVYPYEQDIAIEEIAPFNNKNIILALLLEPALERKSPNYSFFNKFIDKMWKETLFEPINPDQINIIKYISSYAYLKFYLKSIKNSIYNFLK